MDAHQNLAVRLGVAFNMYQKSLLDIAICQLMLDIDKRERRKPRSCWAKSWIQQRPLHGHYDALIPELARNDLKAFKNYTRLPKRLYDELLNRIEGRITKCKSRNDVIPAGLTCRQDIWLPVIVINL